MEGVAAEAASLAGHLKLKNLIVLYDDNQISIDGKTDLAFTEDVCKRFESYGFTCFYVDNGDEDLDSMARALESAIGNTSGPSLIKVKTTIAKGAAGVEGTAKAHGAPLGVEKVKATKQAFGFDPEKTFYVSDAVRDYFAEVRRQKEANAAKWYEKFDQQKTTELERLIGNNLPVDWEKCLPMFEKAEATRKYSELFLNSLAGVLPELIGGSADLTESNLTRWKGALDFQHPDTGLGTYAGRYIRFGVREHAMFAICNGLAAYGCGLIPFASTFLNFITYGWGAVRLSALSHLQVIYVMTHDSIGLGEDGPTHQPVEVLPLLRSLPNCLVFRPADGNEVAGAYKLAVENRTGPSIICLTRQKVGMLDASSPEKVRFGAYTVKECQDPELILVGTGSEVGLCLQVANVLNKSTRVVSFPSWELFDRQPREYKQSVFPPGVKVVSVEASSTVGWHKYADLCIGLEGFGMSGPYEQVYDELGLSVDKIKQRIDNFFESSQ